MWEGGTQVRGADEVWTPSQYRDCEVQSLWYVAVSPGTVTG